jgi:calcineurin-like phosphoesterase
MKYLWREVPTAFEKLVNGTGYFVDAIFIGSLAMEVGLNFEYLASHFTQKSKPGSDQMQHCIAAHVYP